MSPHISRSHSVIAPAVPMSSAKSVLAVIDAATPRPDLLVAGADPEIVIIQLSGSTGVDQITAALADMDQPVDELHLVSHGAPGQLTVGGKMLDGRALAERGRRWRRHLAPDATILLYGCSIGRGEAGRDLVRKLARATGARVLASSTPTGSAARGGDWCFDVTSSGTRPSATASAFRRAHDTWPGLLIAIANTADSGAGSLRAAAAGSPSDYNFTGLTGTQTITLTTGAVTIGGSGPYMRFAGGGNFTIGGGDIALAHTGLFQIFGGSGTNTVTISSNITGGASGTVNFGSAVGSQTVILSGTNSFSSDTRVSMSDKLSISADANLGSGALELDTGTLTVTGATTIDNSITLTGSDNTIETTAGATISGAISSSGSLTKTGASTLTLSGTNTYSGTTSVNAGTLSVSSDSNLGSGAVTLNGGNLTVTGATTIDNGIALSSDATITASADATLSGVISGANNLTKAGTGTLTLSGTNTYSGTTTVSSGSLSVSGNSNLGSGTLTLDGGGLTVTGTFSKAITLGAGDGTLSTAGSDVTVSSIVSGTGDLTKSGSGTLTLSGTNTYSGTTTVNGGTLAIDGSLTASTVTVASGGTLGGSGSVANAVTVSSGGTLAPGNSPGTLSTGDLTLSSGSTGKFEINGVAAGTNHDQIDVTGAVDVTGATLTPVFGFTSATGDVFTLIANDGADAITGTFSALAEGATFNANGRIYKISYTGDTGNDLTLTDNGAVPVAPSPRTAIVGSENADVLDGGSFADTISGLGGDDVIRSYGSGDIVSAGDGDDLIYGNQGSDLLRGEGGNDTVFGGQGADVVYGGADNDWLCGNRDNDILYGNTGNDVVYGNLGADMLFGGQGSDTIYGGQGDDTLAGNKGDDLLFGNLGADTFTFHFGDGNDTVSGYNAAEGDVIQFDTGTNVTSAATETGLTLTAGDVTVSLIGVAKIEDVNILFA